MTSGFEGRFFERLQSSFRSELSIPVDVVNFRLSIEGLRPLQSSEKIAEVAEYTESLLPQSDRNGHTDQMIFAGHHPLPSICRM